MAPKTKQKAKRVALVICFSALYSVLSTLPLSPIIGLSGKAITAAAIVAPIIGIVLGPYLGVAATTIGGLIGLFANLSFSPPSLVSGVATAWCAGLLTTGRRTACAFTYFSLLFLFAFYPFVGPVWTYPPLLWFQIIGFILLLSPVQSVVSTSLRGNKSSKYSKLTLGVFTAVLTSTLAGQIAGSLVSEALVWPIFLADINAWQRTWQLVAVLYPIERTIIALAATVICAPLLKSLRSSNIMRAVNAAVLEERCS